jgi:hypothetical protein
MRRGKAGLGMWRDIPGYDGAYQINLDGEIRSFRWRRERFSSRPKPMIQYMRQRGKTSRRRYVKLTDRQGKAKEIAVIKIMAATWLDGEKPGMVLYHKNGDLSDNNKNNIGYISRKRLGEITGAQSGRKAVMKINQAGEVVEIYTSAREAGRKNHMSYQTVIDRCCGKVKKPFALDGHTYAYEERQAAFQ